VTILALWVVVLLVGVPSAVRDASGILQSQPPGAAHNQALRDLAAKSVVLFVAVPVMVLGIFGYGVMPRKSAPILGGSLFVSMWRPLRRGRSSKTRRPDA
jgi:hypothetical protein